MSGWLGKGTGLTDVVFEKNSVTNAKQAGLFILLMVWI
jgi:hypothetical protein